MALAGLFYGFLLVKWLPGLALQDVLSAFMSCNPLPNVSYEALASSTASAGVLPLNVATCSQLVLYKLLLLEA